MPPEKHKQRYVAQGGDKMNYDYGDKNWEEKQVKHTSPEIWTHKGYKCHMYQSSNGFLNWRCYTMYRPDGSEVKDDEIHTTKNQGQGYNISPNVNRAKDTLKSWIEWDLMTPRQKEDIKRENSNRLLF